MRVSFIKMHGLGNDFVVLDARAHSRALFSDDSDVFCAKFCSRGNVVFHGARDGNARDPDPRDEGDWSHGTCDGANYDSFFHGLFVAGQIAANTDNGIGIAGVAAGVRILPVRTLGACGGTFEDVLEASDARG